MQTYKKYRVRVVLSGDIVKDDCGTNITQFLLSKARLRTK